MIRLAQQYISALRDSRFGYHYQITTIVTTGTAVTQNLNILLF